MLRYRLHAETRGKARYFSFFVAGRRYFVAEPPFLELPGRAALPHCRTSPQNACCGVCLRRTALSSATLSSLKFASHISAAGIFTNARKSYARGTDEEKLARDSANQSEWHNFINQPVDADGGNVPTARDVESRLPSKKQLNEELPTAAELEKALSEGKMEAYVMEPGNDDD